MGIVPKAPKYHPYKAQFNAIYHPPTPINKIKDRSGNNNDAFQIQENFKPGLIFNALNGRNVIQLDGNDFLNFTEDENFIRTMFMVYKRSSGNRGYLLGHDYENAFQSGASSIWDQSWADPFLIFSDYKENGVRKDGLIEDYQAGKFTIISIVTQGNVRASNLSKDPDGTKYLRGNFAEFISYNEVLPTNAVREIEGYLAHKWGLESNFLPTHPYRNEKPVPSEPAAEITLVWGSTDGGTNLDMWENSISLGRIRKGLRKL